MLQLVLKAQSFYNFGQNELKPIYFLNRNITDIKLKGVGLYSPSDELCRKGLLAMNIVVELDGQGFNIYFKNINDYQDSLINRIYNQKKVEISNFFNMGTLTVLE